TINASNALEPEEALQTAERLDRLRKAGRLLGPLHGVPLAHKDMYYRTGKPCRCGSKIRGTFRPAYTATAIKRLEDAGSITIGSPPDPQIRKTPHRTRPATTRISATATTPGMSTIARAAPRRGRARRSPPASSMGRSARTPAAPSGCRRPCAA